MHIIGGTMRRSLRFTAALATLGLSSSGAIAFAPTESGHKAVGGVQVGIRVIRPEVVEASSLALPILFTAKGSTPQASFQVDAASGAMRVVSGAGLSGEKALQALTPEALEAEARAFVAANPELLPLSDDELVVDFDALHISKDEQFVKLRVRRDGLDIADASIDFRFKFGSLVQVASHAFTEAKSDLRPGLGELEQSAKAALIDAAVTPRRELYRVAQAKAGYRLVRVTEFDAQVASGERFLVQVESATGNVFELRPTSFHLSGLGSASIHGRWYNDALEQRALPLLNLPYSGGTATTDASGRFAGAPQSAQPKLQGFAGPKIKIALRSGTQVTQAGSPVRDEWHVVWQKQGSAAASNDLNVAQAMVFYHGNAIVQKAKEILPDVRWLDRQLTANVNLTQTCNAHWDGSTINFYSGGGGCANTGLIADVVYHEWGHGLDDNTGGIEDGAFSEGFGDIMSLAETGSNVLGVGFRLDGSPVRDLEPNKVYPRDANTEVHSEGLIIGSTFYDLFKLLRETYGEEAARAKLRRLALKVILTASRYTDVYEALLVIDDDNGNLNDKTPNYCAINKSFAEHGLATADQACDLATVDEFEVDDSAGNGNGILEPGEQVELWLTARNSGTQEATDLVGLLSVSGAPGIQVTQPELRFGSIPARQTRRSENAAELTVGSDVRCGETFTASARLSSGSRSATVSRQLQVGRLAAQPATHTASGLPKPVRDNQTTEVALEVSGPEWAGGTAVHAARLKFDITHSYVGDLTVKLVSPSGTAKEVFRGSGSGDDVHFDADVTAAVGGQAGKGAWKLQVIDDAAQDTGTLQAFELTLTAAKFQCE